MLVNNEDDKQYVYSLKNMILLLIKYSNTVKNVRLACFGRGLIFSVTVIRERDKETRRETRQRCDAVTVSRFFVAFMYHCNAYFRTIFYVIQ
jgi:hypothetical protein